MTLKNTMTELKKKKSSGKFQLQNWSGRRQYQWTLGQIKWNQKRIKNKKEWRKLLRLRGYHQVRPYLHSGSSRRRRREDRKLIKEMGAENFPNLGRDMDIQVHEDQISPVLAPWNFNEAYYNKTINNQRKTENLENSKRKEVHHTQGGLP